MTLSVRALGFLCIWISTLVVPVCLVAQVNPPRIFYTDIQSGPNTGGENNNGAFVTIYGKGFGPDRGDALVTIGGGVVDNYPAWSDTRITVQLGSAAQTGNIQVVVGGRTSNGVPFTVSCLAC